MTHCWADYGQWIETTYGYLSDEYLDHAAAGYDHDVDAICLRPDGHFGPHTWTPSSQVVVQFAEVAVPSRPETPRRSV